MGRVRTHVPVEKNMCRFLRIKMSQAEIVFGRNDPEPNRSFTNFMLLAFLRACDAQCKKNGHVRREETFLFREVLRVVLIRFISEF